MCVMGMDEKQFKQASTYKMWILLVDEGISMRPTE